MFLLFLVVFSRYNFFDFHRFFINIFPIPVPRNIDFVCLTSCCPPWLSSFSSSAMCTSCPDTCHMRLPWITRLDYKKSGTGTAKINKRLGLTSTEFNSFLKAEQCEDHLASEHSSQFCHRANCFHKRFLRLTHFCKLLLLLFRIECKTLLKLSLGIQFTQTAG